MVTAPSLLDRFFWRLGILSSTSPLRIDFRVVLFIASFHVLALLACIPWLFSWTGLGLAIGGIYVFGTIGINIGYHRLLTHRSFSCPLWLEHFFSVLGTCCSQGSPMGWVAIHRMHHQHSDDQSDDPHTPRSGFFWSHMGWFMVHDPKIQNVSTYDRYARDLFQDRFYKKLERSRNWRMVQLSQWLLFFLVGAIVGGLWTESLLGALQMGLSWFVWGVLVRTVVVWHITWSINSVTHLWGYQNFKTHDDSRNNILVGLISNGEGWHNNHHAEPRSAAHGQRWFEFDVSYITIRLLSLVGLVWGVVKPGWRRSKDTADQPPEIAV